ncbi:MAG: AmmeMemoRadiSam system radical SAM enzyme, partial [Nitrospiraceae bacterium]|nr:AmmeMemoRadiSam system radical SAM enzyme [Nitrospiraceae bacterium]
MARNSLTEHTMPAAAALVHDEGGGVVRCLACANRCRIQDGKAGICCVRTNQGGGLRVPGGYVAGLQVDPIEKKPFYHVFPGREALSFGMFGCNFHCPFCQNWISSQAPREGRAANPSQPVSPERLAEVALAEDAPVIVSTYNEPLITADWAYQVFEKAKEKGVVCGFVSNGYATPEVLDFLRPVMDLYKVDLKCFDDEHYRTLGGRLNMVLDTIERLCALGFWVEVVTLVIPDFNDSSEQLNDMARFLARISPDTPWHVTAFHPDYQMTHLRRTSAADLQRAYDAGKNAGLRHVYCGNLPGSMGGAENTHCHNCHALLVERQGFYVMDNRMTGGCCPDCGT